MANPTLKPNVNPQNSPLKGGQRVRTCQKVLTLLILPTLQWAKTQTGPHNVTI